MPRDTVLAIIDEFIAKAKNATDDELAETAINDAVSKGATLANLEDGIVSLGLEGRDLKRPFGEEAATVPNTPTSQNLLRVFRILQQRK